MDVAGRVQRVALLLLGEAQHPGMHAADAARRLAVIVGARSQRLQLVLRTLHLLQQVDNALPEELQRDTHAVFLGAPLWEGIVEAYAGGALEEAQALFDPRDILEVVYFVLLDGVEAGRVLLHPRLHVPLEVGLVRFDDPQLLEHAIALLLALRALVHGDQDGGEGHGDDNAPQSACLIRVQREVDLVIVLAPIVSMYIYIWL
jgi:hypothetical protein